MSQIDWSMVGNLETYPEVYANVMETLNAAMDAYALMDPDPPALRRLAALNVQAAMNSFDIVHEWGAVQTRAPTGFALQVALRGVVLRCFEFHIAMNEVLLPAARANAAELGLEFDSARMKAKRKELWPDGLEIVAGWADLRNHAAGHYGKDHDKQFAEIQSIDFNTVLTATGAMVLLLTEFVRTLTACAKPIMDSINQSKGGG